MANINLITSKEDEKAFGSGTSGLFVVLFTIIAIYVLLLFYGSYLEKSSVKLKEEYDNKRLSFVAGDSRKVLDFQNRLLIAKNLVIQERSVNDDIKKIEELFIVGMYLNSYNYDEIAKTITLDCYADSYEIVAKQILSFKSDEYFSTVSIGATEFDAKTGKINFPITLTIK
ncbi:MAG TPA: hypothetical protein DCS28_02715 [Candidatus Moranbacteria bacterium]|nr:hypothetical protein [Candidatus Moranbacteria bacterium]HAT74928.1 hypothetical protein [Candidatus Moranbacteria bacterium]